MEIVILPDAERVGSAAADRIARVVTATRGAVLGVATGSSPLALYAELARRIADGDLEMGEVSAFALDEYVGLDEDHPQSYHHVIRQEVTGPLRLRPEAVHVPDGLAADLEAGCRDYEKAIHSAGGVDVQILGIGANGHIGFNEPSSSLASRTRVKTLASRTREDNARFFDGLDEVPRHCVTQGLGTIMEAREIVLVAQGAHKADAVARAAEGPVTASCPASVLQFHPRTTFFLDEAAAARLEHLEYYREVDAHRP